MAARAKSRRQRARQAVPRASRSLKLHASTAAAAESDSLFTVGTDGYNPAPPISQTGSWKLVPVSAGIWLKNYNTSIALFMLPLLVIVLGGVIIGNGNVSVSRLSLGITLITLTVIWQAINIPAALYFQLHAAKGLSPAIRQCYRGGWRLAPRLLGLSMLTSVLIFGGLLLFVVPGLIMIRRYILAPYYLLDGDLGIREAMQRSAADTKEVPMYVWGVYGVLFGINLLLFISVGQIAGLFGPLLAAFLTSLYYFGPALRYKEVALRRNAYDFSDNF
jgi:hypothetical protein